MEEFNQKKATRNMIFFLLIALAIGSLLVAYSMNLLSGAQSVSISCSDQSVTSLLKTALIKSNPNLSNAKISFTSITTLENINKGRQIKCRSAADIVSADESEKNNYILDFNSTLADDSSSQLLVIDKITQINN